jgi:hypothetical protein
MLQSMPDLSRTHRRETKWFLNSVVSKSEHPLHCSVNLWRCDFLVTGRRWASESPIVRFTCAKCGYQEEDRLSGALHEKRQLEATNLEMAIFELIVCECARGLPRGARHDAARELCWMSNLNCARHQSERLDAIRRLANLKKPVLSHRIF